MGNSIRLSQMDCYTGKIRAEVNAFGPDIHSQPGLYLQFVEGCGYDVKTLTPDEAEQLAELLLKSAFRTRKAFKIKPILDKYIQENKVDLQYHGIDDIKYDESDDTFSFYSEEIGFIYPEEMDNVVRDVILKDIEHFYNNRNQS